MENFIHQCCLLSFDKGLNEVKKMDCTVFPRLILKRSRTSMLWFRHVFQSKIIHPAPGLQSFFFLVFFLFVFFFCERGLWFTLILNITLKRISHLKNLNYKIYFVHFSATKTTDFKCEGQLVPFTECNYSLVCNSGADLQYKPSAIIITVKTIFQSG